MTAARDIQALADRAIVAIRSGIAQIGQKGPPRRLPPSPAPEASAESERPILFSAPMVRALLAGTKKQTRRVVKNPERYEGGLQNCLHCCPYGQAGDRLWVREAWAPRPLEPARECVVAACRGTDDARNGPWKPSIHMPRWASRIQLEITDVRVERLQDISDDDLAAEGIQELIDAGVDHDGTPRDTYRALWEALNGPGSWAANPWVWAVSFRALATRERGGTR
jgi:hypothetical protein